MSEQLVWTSVWLLGAIFLGWSLGRNNLSNLFGPAVGTEMIPFKLAVCLASCFVFLGAFLSGYATTAHVNSLAPVASYAQAFAICISAGVVIYLLGFIGVPASITQTSTGALIAWNIFFHVPLNNHLIIKTFLSWVYTPFLSGFVAFLLFYLLRFLLKKYKMHLLTRDYVIRMSLIAVGIFSAFVLGANNVASIAGPYISVDKSQTALVFCLTCFAICIGFFSADRRVIQTVSKKMYPLSPLEALVVMFSSAGTLFCFSSTTLKAFLESLSLPSFPLVPVPLAVAVIGSILAVAVCKGIDGLKFKTAGRVVLSWFLAPCSAGIICYMILYICHWKGFV